MVRTSMFHNKSGIFAGFGDFSFFGVFFSGRIFSVLSKENHSFGSEHKLRSRLRRRAFHRTDSQDPEIHVLGG